MTRDIRVIFVAVCGLAFTACGQRQVPQPPADAATNPLSATTSQGHPRPKVTIARVSGASPYKPGDCGDDTTQYGYETDPALTLAPQGLIAAWEQDTYNGTPGAVVGYSFDGGTVWNE